MRRESVILCEGYHDRAFWDGWLRFLGCKVPLDPAKPLLKLIKDPWGSTVAGGQFGYHAPSGEFVRLMPCHGDEFVRQALKLRLGQRATRPLSRLVVTYDADTDARSDVDARQGIESARHSVETVLNEVAPGFTRGPDGDYLLEEGATVVSVVVWWAPDQHLPGLPAKQTLERLACAALVGAFPERAQAVEQWLQGRPAGPTAGPKEYAWSNMAGWYAEKGCEAFYSELWSAPQVAAELQARLVRSGAWDIARRLAAP